MKTEKPSDKDQNLKKKQRKPAKEAPSDEKGGFKDVGLLEPTRYDDWEVKGRCSDF